MPRIARARGIPGLVCLALPLAAAAETYYVAPPPAGHDANPGSEAAPWATLQHAVDAVVPGDTVLVRSGEYAGAHMTTSGSADARIVLAAFPGEQPVVNANNPVTPDGINLEGADHVTVRGFRVTGTGRAGIRAVLCRHVHIQDNISDGNGRWGILTGFCDDLLIEGNTTSNNAVEHGIYVSNSGDRPVIRGNLVFGNDANGIHMNGDVFSGSDAYDGVVDGVISQAVVEDNILFDNGSPNGGSAINGDGLQDSLIRNNLVYDQHASGISLYRTDGGAPSHGNRVLNNTILVAADGRWALNIQDGSQGTRVFNNVLHSEHGFRGAMNVCGSCLVDMASDHNAVEDRFTLDGGDSVLTLAQWSAQTGFDSRSLAATPAGLLVAPAAGDHRLRADSPARDAGTPRADVPDDLEGTPRPQGPGWDNGAYEVPDPQSVFRDGFES